MKYLGIISIVFIGYYSISCSTCKKVNDSDEVNVLISDKAPNTIQQNLSLVTAELINVEDQGGELYKLKAKILSVENTESLPSIAASGNDYLLVPAYQYDSESLIPNDINTGLKELKIKPVGTRFEAEIFLDAKLGWVLQKVIKYY